MYWEGNDNIPSLWNNSLHDWFLLYPIIILIILFCNLKILILSVEDPQKIRPYVIMSLSNWYIRLSVLLLAPGFLPVYVHYTYRQLFLFYYNVLYMNYIHV